MTPALAVLPDDRETYTVFDTINEMIDKAISKGDYVPAIVASKLVKRLRSNDPKLLAEWLDHMAETILTDYVGDRARMQRNHAMSTAAGREFSRQAKAAHDDGGEAVTLFAATYAINEENLRRPVGEMTGTDHMYVAGRYEQSGKSALMKAAFHRAVGKKIGNRRTQDVLTPNQYEELLKQMLGPSKLKKS